MDLGPSTTTAEAVLDAGLGESAWVQPVADGKVLPTTGDPAELAAARETIRLAFVAALQHLPPRQRAVLILREVLRWQATEVAELLDTSVASVNSALQRARATLATHDLDESEAGTVDADQEELLARYVDAFERYDIASLVTLLHEDATFSMPPHPVWLEGPLEVSRWLLGPGLPCKGSKLLAGTANGCPAYAQYKPVGGGRYEPWSIQVLEITDGRITAWNNFLYPHLFAEFGFPDHLQD
jgi:RNA polymerase sigma-70 factor (ECF subfamily)